MTVFGYFTRRMIILIFICILFFTSVLAVLVGKAWYYIDTWRLPFFRSNSSLAGYFIEMLWFTLIVLIIAISWIYFFENWHEKRDISIYEIVLYATTFIVSCDWQINPATIFSNFSINNILIPLQFIASTTGICALSAFMKTAKHEMQYTDKKILNTFCEDLLKFMLMLMLPMCFIFGIILNFNEVPQIKQDNITYTNLFGFIESIRTGFVASFEAIKVIGNNGGELYEANAAHPFENPSVNTSVLKIAGMVILPMASTFYVYYHGYKYLGAILYCIQMLFVFVSIMLGYWFFISMDTLEIYELRLGKELSFIYNMFSSANSGGGITLGYEHFNNYNVAIFTYNVILGGAMFGGGIGIGLISLMSNIIIALFIMGMVSSNTQTFMKYEIIPQDIKSIMLLFTINFAVIAVGTILYVIYFEDIISSKQLSKVFMMFLSTVLNNGTSLYVQDFDNDAARLIIIINNIIGRITSLLLVYYLARNFFVKSKVFRSEFLYEKHFALIPITMIVMLGGITCYIPFIFLGALISN